MTEKIDLEERRPRSYHYEYTVKSLTDDGPWQKGQEYSVFIDRMTHKRFNIYFKDNFKDGAGQAYRAFDTPKDLEAKFELLSLDHVPPAMK